MKQKFDLDDMNREEFLLELIRLKEQDPAAFMQLILDSLKRNPEMVVADHAPAKTKLQALAKMLHYLEEKESYEDCAFIRDLNNKIKDDHQE